MGLKLSTQVLAGGKNATGIQVPEEIVLELASGRKPAVKVEINGYTFRSTIMFYEGQFMLPLSAENRNAAGVQAGDNVILNIELDTEIRTVEIPLDLTAVLEGTSGTKAVFDGLSYSKRKEYVRQVEDAKTLETRNKRIATIITSLAKS
jgi:hypothetical protein